MTLMLILGAVAALCLARLFCRLMIRAAPISAALMAGSLLQADGWCVSGAAAIGVGVGLCVFIAGRTFVSGDFPVLVRLPVLIIFSGTAGRAGYQAGSAFADLGGAGAGLGDDLALAIALITAAACWRDLVRESRRESKPDVRRADGRAENSVS